MLTETIQWLLLSSEVGVWPQLWMFGCPQVSLEQTST